MSTIGVITGFNTQLSKRFVDIEIVNTVTSTISSSGSDLTITSSSGNNIVFNDNVKVTTSGILDINSAIRLYDKNDNTYNKKLYNDGNNLVWGSDVIVTDATIESEIENITRLDIDTITLSGSISGTSDLTGLIITGKTTLNNKTYTWPTSSGSNLDFLTTNGNGILTWNSLNNYNLTSLGDVTLTNSANGSILTYNGSGGWISSKSLNINVLEVSSGATLPRTTTIGSVTYTFPSSDGSGTQYLKTNGSANLSWGKPSLSDLTDASFNSLAVNDFITYNGTKWINTDTINIGTIGGTISTPEQPNITHTGTLEVPMSVTINGSGSYAGRIILRNASNYISISASPDMNTNFLLKLPSSDGLSNQVLKTDGSGNLSWIHVANTINDATDTSFNNLLPNDILKYMGDKWINSKSIEITDLQTTNLTLNETLITATGDDINKLNGITSSTAELNILTGVTATSSDINKLNGMTSSTAELNILTGLTSSTAELNILTGLTSSTAELNILTDVTATSSDINKLNGMTSSTAELNILTGLTSSTAELNILTGVTSSTAELNILTGLTSSTAELNILTGLTSSTAELNILTGVTSSTAELNILTDVTATSSDINKLNGMTSSTAELNILTGLTSSTAELNILTGLTSSTTELNILTGLTSSTTELNILTGLTSSTAELNILTGLTSSTAELNILTGLTSSTAELNLLTGLTSSTAELNILTGLTSSTAELNILTGVTSSTAELNLLTGLTSSTAELNTLTGLTSSTAELNTLTGLTSSTAELNTLTGLTSSTAELNILTGLTSSTAELNTLTGLTSSTAELNILTGLTSSTAELNTLTGLTSSTAELNTLTGLTSSTAELNTLTGLTSSTAELNTLTGLTSSTAELNLLTGLTSSTTELNILTGLTSSTAELNILTGVTATSAELNYLDITTLGTAEISKALVVDNSNNIVGLGNLGVNAVNANTLSGTIQTSEQPNITSVGSVVTIIGQETLGAKLILRESTANGTNEISISAPVSLSNNYSYTWPSNYGTASQYLQTNGSGGLVWANGDGGGGGGGGITTIAEATDTNIVDPTNNQLLTYDSEGGTWYNSSSIRVTDIYLNDVLITASATELNYVDIETIGTSSPSKALVTDASNNITGIGNLGVNTLSANSLTGTIQTSEQPNITSVGTLEVPVSVTVLGQTTSGAKLVLKEATNNGVHYVSIQAPSSLADNYTLVLPANDGDNGQILTTNGNGVLSWSNGGDLPTNIVSPNDQDLLVYNSETGTWNNLTSISVTGLTLNGTSITATGSELNILSGVTATTTELNTLSGVYATSTELNTLSGVYATANELNLLSGLMATTPELNTLSGIIATTTELNTLSGIAVTSTELNTLSGLITTTAELNILSGVIATADELNILSGVVANANELNILSGVIATPTELNILSGVIATSNELNALSGIAVTSTELNVLSGVIATSTELNKLSGVITTSDELNILSGATVTFDELNYLDVVTKGQAEPGKALVTDGFGSIIGIGNLSVDNVLVGQSDSIVNLFGLGASGQLVNVKGIKLIDNATSSFTTFSNINSVTIDSLLLMKIASGTITGTDCSSLLIKGPPIGGGYVTLTAGTTYSLKVDSGMTYLGGGLRMKESGGGDNFVNIRTSSGMVSNVNFILPDGYGQSGDILSTDGSGNLSWVTGGTVVNMDISASGANRVLTTAGADRSIQEGLSTYEFRSNNMVGSTLKIYGSSSANNYVGFKAPTTISSSIVWELPDVDGATGQYLKTNGNGALLWDNPSSGVVINPVTMSSAAGGSNRIITTAGSDRTAKEGSQIYECRSILGSGSQLRLYGSSSANNYVGLSAPTSIGSSISWRLPSTDGLSNQYLTTNGMGILSWASFASPGSIILTNGANNRIVTTTSSTDLNAESNLTFDGVMLTVGTGSNVINAMGGSLSVVNGVGPNYTAHFESTIQTNNSAMYTISGSVHVFNSDIRNSGITLERNVDNSSRLIHMFIGPTVAPSNSSFSFSSFGTAPLVIQNMDASFNRFIWYSGSAINGMDFFTGQHGCASSDVDIKSNVNNYVGLIVSANGNYSSPSQDNYATVLNGKNAIQINNSLPIVELTTSQMDKKVFGVISNGEEVGSTSRSFGKGAWGMMISKESGDDRLIINSVGEGGIWVTNINGNFENGDYITSSVIPGYGMKQNDDLLHNYTVAKITMTCNFDNSGSYQMKSVSHNDQTYIAAFVGCTYHCG
uniref:Peptidase S74 domain-containing protein n=1 Tax=viral metagenome TaxID=1070528 RepID=A0A6C0E863_9ZZZZ